MADTKSETEKIVTVGIRLSTRNRLEDHLRKHRPHPPKADIVTEAVDRYLAALELEEQQNA